MGVCRKTLRYLLPAGQYPLETPTPINREVMNMKTFFRKLWNNAVDLIPRRIRTAPADAVAKSDPDKRDDNDGIDIATRDRAHATISKPIGAAGVAGRSSLLERSTPAAEKPQPYVHAMPPASGVGSRPAA